MNDSAVWFITGASSGFGKAFTEYAIEQGYRVVATARKREGIEPLAAQYPDRVLAVPMDVRDRAQIEEAVRSAINRFGAVDVLINNAGYGIVGAVEETPEEELRALMDTNFFGAVAVTRAFLPHFRRQGRGAIVNISSLGGQLSMSGFGPYSASKFALEGISEALAQELKPLGIKVLIVEPGQFRTNLAGASMRFMPEIEAYAATAGPTRQFARSSDGTQFGDPHKAARVIDVALRDPNTPLRLQLGKDAVDMIRAHAETMLTDMKQWEAVTVDTRLAE